MRRVEVRRVWPDRLHVVLEEHVALARWGDSALVNTHGELFSAASDASLPMFSGPSGSAPEVARRYLRLREALAPAGLVPAELTLSERRAWELRLAGGLLLRLGRDQVEERLATFLAVYAQTVAPVASRLDYVDLRYPNGFAVRVSGRREGGGEANTRPPQQPRAAPERRT